MAAGVHGSACQSLGWPIVGVASRQAERARTLAKALNTSAVSYDDVLGERLAEIVIVTTPPACHSVDTKRLLDIGYHVVVESPLSCTLADADQLIEAEQQAGRPVLYSEHLTAAPAIGGLLSRVAGMGHVTHLSARAIRRAPTWRSSNINEWGGGVLFDLGVHPIALLLRTADVAGLGAPSSVTGTMAPAAATAQVHFESGTVARLTVGWQPDVEPSGDLQVSSAQAVLRVDLYPTPTLESNGDPVRLDSEPSSPATFLDDYGYAPQLRRFWGDIRMGRPVPTTTDFGRRVLEIVAAAHWSAGAGATDVPLPFQGSRTMSPIELWHAAHPATPTA
jgi:predicted dehydrogenase